MHGRDATVLLSCTTPACFSIFQCTMVPTLADFLVYLFVNFFGNTIIMIMIEIQCNGTALLSMHTISKQWYCPPQLYQVSSTKEDALLPAMFNPLYKLKTV